VVSVPARRPVQQYSMCLINAVTGKVGTGPNMSGYPTSQAQAILGGGPDPLAVF